MRVQRNDYITFLIITFGGKRFNHHRNSCSLLFKCINAHSKSFWRASHLERKKLGSDICCLLHSDYEDKQKGYYKQLNNTTVINSSDHFLGWGS